MLDMTSNNELRQQFIRRTPVKLRQFSRLLDDMMTQSIDALRVKALLSQVNKVKDSCAAYGYETTAKLLNQLLMQLSLSESALETQKPLLKRLSAKLQEHAKMIDLGVKPHKRSPEPVADAAGQEQSPAATEVIESQEQTAAAEPLLVIQESAAQIPAEAEEEVIDEDDSLDHSLEEFGIYLDKSTIIFVSKQAGQFDELSSQFVSLGVDTHTVDCMNLARQKAIDSPGSIMVAPMDFAEHNQKLDDDEVETQRIPLIYVSPEDNQVERLQALRSGGTGFLVEPVSISALLELIERQYDLHADSPYRILVMEDSKAQAKYYDKVLSKGHFEVRVVSDPEVLFEALRGFEPETVLMDMQMPGCSGIELTRIIRQIPRYAYLPIIFMSAEENERKQNQALLAGGTSFVVKPVQKEQVIFLCQLYANRYRGLNPQIGLNPDTGLPFSGQFKQQVSIETSRIARNRGNAALAIIQLDETANLIASADFSMINVAIQQLSLLLKKRLRKSDIIGHLETGQLAVILNTGNKADWRAIINEVRSQFEELPFQYHHENKGLTVSAGVASLSSNGDAHDWFESAFKHLEEACSQGGNRVMPEALD